jgi:hypothetical protein
VRPHAAKYYGANLPREDSRGSILCVRGYYASKQSGLAGVFRRDTADGSDWKHALSEIEAFTVFVMPHGTLMSVGLHHGDARQVYVAARYGEVFGTQDGGERACSTSTHWLAASGAPWAQGDLSSLHSTMRIT